MGISLRERTLRHTSHLTPDTMTNYQKMVDDAAGLLRTKKSWGSIKAEYVTRMMIQNQFKTGLDVAKYTAEIMRKDMEDYDRDQALFTKSLGCWHGFVAQQKMIGIKRHFGSTEKRYLYLSGWMIAAMRSEFGPPPDQSMHEKSAVPALIEEIYTFLRQADARELNKLFRLLDKARKENNKQEELNIITKIDNFQTHIVPIVADIDAGFGNEEATYQLAKKMIMAVRYAFLELGVTDGVIVARTDSLGAGLTQKLPVSKTPCDLASQYNSFLETIPVHSIEDLQEGETLVNQDGKLFKTVRMPNGLYKFREDSNEARVILDCVTSLQNGADLLWIETATPDLKKISSLVNAIRSQVPSAKLVYNNSPSFNWTLNFRQQVYDEMLARGDDVTDYDRALLMSSQYDLTPLGLAADQKIKTFQCEASQMAGVFHHLITLPTYHTAALSTDLLTKG